MGEERGRGGPRPRRDRRGGGRFRSGGSDPEVEARPRVLRRPDAGSRRFRRPRGPLARGDPGRRVRDRVRSVRRARVRGAGGGLPDEAVQPRPGRGGRAPRPGAREGAIARRLPRVDREDRREGPSRPVVPGVGAAQGRGEERLRQGARHRLDRVAAQQRPHPRRPDSLPPPRDDDGDRVAARPEAFSADPPLGDREHRADPRAPSVVQRRLRGRPARRHPAHAVGELPRPPERVPPLRDVIGSPLSARGERVSGVPRTARQRWTSAAWILGVWLFVGILQATQRYLRGRELEPNSWAFWSALGENLVLAALWAAMTPLVMRLARRWPFPGRSWPVLLAVHVPMGAAVVLLHTVVSHVVYKLLIAPGVP